LREGDEAFKVAARKKKAICVNARAASASRNAEETESNPPSCSTTAPGSAGKSSKPVSKQFSVNARISHRLRDNTDSR
jgi:hypothetical protein